MEVKGSTIAWTKLYKFTVMEGVRCVRGHTFLSSDFISKDQAAG